MATRGPSPDPGPRGLQEGLQALLDLAVGFLLFFVAPQVFFATSSSSAISELERIEEACFARALGILLLVIYACFRYRAFALRCAPGRALLTYFAFLAFWIPLAMILYPYVLHALGHELPAQGVVEYFAAAAPTGMFWLVLGLACIGAPIAEEIFFRGVLFRPLQIHFGAPVAVVVTALLFGAVHEQSVALPVAGLGLLFGYLRWKTGGVGASILIHIVHNSWTVALVLYNPNLLDLVYDR